MDREIKPTRNTGRIIKMAVIACSLSGAIAWAMNSNVMPTGGRNYTQSMDNIKISNVTQGQFQEYLPLRATVAPEKTIFIDAIDGGRVEQLLVEEGVMLEAGAPILKLSNTSLQLNVLAREAEVSEQINNMRNTRLALEQNQLRLKRDVIELDYQVQRLEKQLARNEKLKRNGLISEQQYDNIVDELDYQLKYRQTVRQSQEKEALLQEQQLTQLASSIDTLKSNLAISRQSLDNLTIKAPVGGQLTFLNAEVGESKQAGQRLGQLDLIDQLKVTAQIDEFYVNRVSTGQSATFEMGGTSYSLKLQKIYPGIDDGSFKVDFSFDDPEFVSQLRRGQTLQIKFQLGDSTERLQVSNGSFLQDSGGQWVFVLDETTNRATRRSVSVGRRNPESVEILSGLKVGERVITSSYASYLEMDQLTLTKN